MLKLLSTPRIPAFPGETTWHCRPAGNVCTFAESGYGGSSQEPGNNGFLFTDQPGRRNLRLSPAASDH